MTELTKDSQFGSHSKDKISTMRRFDDVHVDGVVWKDRLLCRLQNHNRAIVDGTLFKDGKKATALTEGRSEELEALGGPVTGLKLHALGRRRMGKQKVQRP